MPLAAFFPYPPPTDRPAAQYKLPFVAETTFPVHISETGSVFEPPTQGSGDKLPSAQDAKTPGHALKQKRQKRKPPATVPLDGKLLVSREEAAAMLSISIRAVDYKISTGQLLTRRIANRVLIPIEEMHRFARSDHPERMAG